MGAVDFEEWAAPGLKLTFGEGTFMVSPPNVDRARKILAAAVRGEIKLGLVPGRTEVPAPVQAILDELEPDEHPGLGDAHAALVEAGVPVTTIDRMAYYSVFYWARGREYADALATALWSEEGSSSSRGGPPKG